MIGRRTDFERFQGGQAFKRCLMGVTGEEPVGFAEEDELFHEAAAEEVQATAASKPRGGARARAEAP